MIMIYEISKTFSFSKHSFDGIGILFPLAFIVVDFCFFFVAKKVVLLNILYYRNRSYIKRNLRIYSKTHSLLINTQSTSIRYTYIVIWHTNLRKHYLFVKKNEDKYSGNQRKLSDLELFILFLVHSGICILYMMMMEWKIGIFSHVHTYISLMICHIWIM